MKLCMACGLDNTIVAMLNFQDLIITLWLCKRMSLFLGNTRRTFRDKRAMSAIYPEMVQKKNCVCVCVCVCARVCVCVCAGGRVQRELTISESGCMVVLVSSL